VDAAVKDEVSPRPERSEQRRGRCDPCTRKSISQRHPAAFALDIDADVGARNHQVLGALDIGAPMLGERSWEKPSTALALEVADSEHQVMPTVNNIIVPCRPESIGKPVNVFPQAGIVPSGSQPLNTPGLEARKIRSHGLRRYRSGGTRWGVRNLFLGCSDGLGHATPLVAGLQTPSLQLVVICLADEHLPDLAAERGHT
jgi:hypothetical protein